MGYINASDQDGDKKLIRGNNAAVWKGKEEPDLDQYYTEDGFTLSVFKWNNVKMIISEPETTTLGDNSSCASSDSEM